ncbi:hypothetical protein [Bradyrhizobium sp. USDA 4502]
MGTPVDRGSEYARFENAPLGARFATSVAAFGSARFYVAESAPASSGMMTCCVSPREQRRRSFRLSRRVPSVGARGQNC